jgi:hypothetical protein
MHRGLSRIAVVIALGLAAFNAATMSLSPAQGPTGIPDSEREYRQATWTLLNSIKNRQVRQDRILGFGFGATVALLIGPPLHVTRSRWWRGIVVTLLAREGQSPSDGGNCWPHSAVTKEW